MRTILTVPILAVLLLGSASRPGAQEDKPPNDKELIQGAWSIFAVEINGRAVPDGDDLKRFQEVTLTFKGDAVVNSREKDVQSKFILDSTKKPGTLDIVTTKQNTERKMLYLYHLDGDVLRLCFTRNSDVFRPRELTSDNLQFMLFLRRQKPPEKEKEK
jgi:uncharacterized protein (TIGR03067 family)